MGADATAAFGAPNSSGQTRGVGAGEEGFSILKKKILPLQLIASAYVGHAQGKAGRSVFRYYVNAPLVRLGNFGANIQPQAQTFAAAPRAAAKKWLKQPSPGVCIDRGARVGYGQLKMRAAGARMHTDGRARRPVHKRIAQQVGQ